jgi:hypothetical protein
MKAWHACQPPVRDALSSGRIITNHFLKIVACMLWGWSSPLLYAATDEIAGGETNLVGTTECIVSHRFQKHSWITPDGRFHVMIRKDGLPQQSVELSTHSVGRRRSPPLQRSLSGLPEGQNCSHQGEGMNAPAYSAFVEF